MNNKVKIIVGLIYVLCISIKIININPNDLTTSLKQNDYVINVKVSKDDKSNINKSSNVKYKNPDLYGLSLGDYEVTFTNPKDYISIPFYIQNDENKEVVLDEIKYNNTKCIGNKVECELLLNNYEYKVLYSETNKELKVGDVISPKSSKKVYANIKYNAEDNGFYTNLKDAKLTNLGIDFVYRINKWIIVK